MLDTQCGTSHDEVTTGLAAAQWPICCPHDYAELAQRGAALVCTWCRRMFPAGDIISFIQDDDFDRTTEREVRSRDNESSWYDSMFEGYTNAVEIPAMLERVGPGSGIAIDHGCGTGRMTLALAKAGYRVIGIDYSAQSLRRMLERTRGYPVLAVQADVRRLPVRDRSVEAVLSSELYEHICGADERARVLREIARVLKPHGRVAISTFNFNLAFQLWSLRGNAGAREGRHLLGGDFYYIRQTKRELVRELCAVFDIESVNGIRNIPARTLANIITRAGFKGAGDRFLTWMEGRGHRLDRALERTPISDALGLFWAACAKVKSPP